MTPASTITLLTDRSILVVREAPRPAQLTENGCARPAQQDAWDSALERLQAWLAAPSLLDDVESERPSPDVIRGAMAVLATLREQGFPAEFVPVPSGAGGVSFERDRGTAFEEYELEKTGRLRYRCFRDGRMTRDSVIGWLPIPPEPTPA